MCIRDSGKPDPEKIKAFKASHPDSLPQAEFLAKHNPPPSWVNSSYFGIHAFKFVNRDNKTTLVRWRFVPEDGEKQLSDDELKSAPKDFLEEKLIDRTRGGPVSYTHLDVYKRQGHGIAAAQRRPSASIAFAVQEGFSCRRSDALGVADSASRFC